MSSQNETLSKINSVENGDKSCGVERDPVKKLNIPLTWMTRQVKMDRSSDRADERTGAADGTRTLKPKSRPARTEGSKVNTVDKCKCIHIEGHLEYVNWSINPRIYRPSPGYLSLGDWTNDPHIWMQYVESCDGLLADDDVLMSTDTRYWEIDDVQRYFLADEHCEQVLFTYQYPNLRMPSAYGDHLWRLNTATKLPSNQFQKEKHRDLAITLKKMEANEDQYDRLIIPDQLVKLDRLDYFRRKAFFRSLLNSLSSQNQLQLVSFENMHCKRLEGVRLIQQLATFNADSLKYLFLWGFVLPNENPLLINYSYITGSGRYLDRTGSKNCFLRSLGELQNLRVLALEYSFLADGTGASLLSLLPVIKRPHFRLQLMCRETHVPGQTDAARGAGGHYIPDTVWRRIIVACPNLYLHMTFFRIRDYDNTRRFLSPSMNLREVHWQLGIDLKMKQRQDSDMSCFVRYMAFHYADTLTTFSVHQWRFVTFHLRCVLEMMPHLVRFHYLGIVEDELDLRKLLNIVATGVCHKLREIRIQIQDDKNKRVYWKGVAELLMREFNEIMSLYDISLCLTVYKN